MPKYYSITNFSIKGFISSKITSKIELIRTANLKNKKPIKKLKGRRGGGGLTTKSEMKGKSPLVSRKLWLQSK